MIRVLLKKVFPRSCKNALFNAFGKIIWKFYQVSVKCKLSKVYVFQPCEMLLITIAYNNEALIRKQIELIKKYIKDENYTHVIVDNSPKREKRKLIKDICDANKVDYVAIPFSIEQRICKKCSLFGLSHGNALNWTFYHLIKQSKPKRFALLDHDIFPIRDCNLTECLGDLDFYGAGRERGNTWYIWPGWSIFRFDAIVSRQPNFQPVFLKDIYLDAGGGNYFQIYRHYELNHSYFPKVKTYRIKQSKDLFAHDEIYHSDCVQFVGNDWLHIINGSNYCKLKDKDALVEKIINNISYFQSDSFC